MEWNGVEWILVEYDYFKRCWPARPAPGCYFSVKWTFIGLTSVKKVLMTMPPISKTFPVCRFSQNTVWRTDFSEFVFFFGSIFDFVGKQSKIDRNKSTNFKKSVLQTVFCEKRQTGNVLLIVNIVIRTFLAELRPMKVHFTEK